MGLGMGYYTWLRNSIAQFSYTTLSLVMHQDRTATHTYLPKRNRTTPKCTVFAFDKIQG